MALYCVENKPEEHILNTQTCADKDCERQPCFGPLGGEKTYCSEHKSEGDVHLCNETYEHEGCERSKSFGFPKERKRGGCCHHKEDGCINLVEIKCAMACCALGYGTQSRYLHPDYQDKTSDFYKQRVCSFARRALIEDALMAGNVSIVDNLLAHFKLEKVLTLNAQSAFPFACEKHYHELLKDCENIVFDDTVTPGPKITGDKRPDISYKWRVGGKDWGIHVEYDETAGHKDETERLEWIAEQAGCEGRVYLIRVPGGHGTKDAVCTRVTHEYFGFHRVTEFG